MFPMIATAIVLYTLAFVPEICLMIRTHLLPCLRDICVTAADTVLHIMERHRQLKDAHMQVQRDSEDRSYEKRTETLTNAMCKMAKAGVPAEAVTEFVRSEKGSQSKQDKHTLSQIILEALKALSAFLKILR